MAKQKRIYVPIDENMEILIKDIAKNTDRSDAYIAAKLISDGIKFNMLTEYKLSPLVDPTEQFKLNHK